MKLIFAMGFENLLNRFSDILPVDDEMKREEGDTFRSCLAGDYHQNLPQVELAPFAPVQFKALTITCGALLVLSVVTFAREKYKKRFRRPKFSLKLRRNKVAVAGPGGVADLEVQSEQLGRNEAPLARVVAAIEVVEREKEQDTLNSKSMVEVSSMELFNPESSPQQDTIAEPSVTDDRMDRSAQSSCKNALLRQEVTEIEVFSREERQDTSNVQSIIRLAPLTDSSNRRSDLAAEMWGRVRSEHKSLTRKVTPL